MAPITKNFKPCRNEKNAYAVVELFTGTGFDRRAVARLLARNREGIGAMASAAQYRRLAWDCLRLAEGTSNPQTRASMLNLAQEWVGLAKQAERNGQYQRAGYRAKAWECISRAEAINDPERRADLLGFGRLWMSLAEPPDAELRGAYELPRAKAA